MTRAQALQRLQAWFAARGWRPLPFQRAMWRHYLAGESGLLHTPTGSGKTLAMFGGPLLQALIDPPPAPARASAVRPLQVLWVTPLRALASDTARALQTVIDGIGLGWKVGLRSGDASNRERRQAREGRVDVLVTTPESLALLLSHADTLPRMQHLRCVVVDEWHELLGSKRGVLLQLNLARLRDASPRLQLWGLSATLGNLQQARQVLLPDQPDAPLVEGARQRPVQVQTLLPPAGERFPWAGHLGLVQLPRVLQAIQGARSTLLFTNTRAQAELWHQALAAVWPEDATTLALHHGSLDPTLRQQVEDGLRAGSLRCVVATSSLDLGVDFPEVDQVLQLGSPKGVARLRQRAGRARHRPGASGRITCIPSHALEVAEFAAARNALRENVVEARRPRVLSLDVLAQHAVSCALAGGFQADVLLAQVRRTHAFADLTDAQWQAVLDFIVQGGRALSQYPDFHKVQVDDSGTYRVPDRRQALRHRLSIGTISSDGSVRVQFLRGGSLGSVEEQFAGRLRPGDRFQFAGRLLELVQLRDMTAYVRLARVRGDGSVPRWQGGQLPLSMPLGQALLSVLSGSDDSAESTWLAPLLALQARVSARPSPAQLLMEDVRRREGQFVFVYPFAGRHVHEALAALLSLRCTRLQRNSIGYAVNDHGLVLAPAQPITLDAQAWHALFTGDGLLDDLRAAVNLGELARRQFRGIARVAGLLVPSLPGGMPRSLRQLQASAGLLHDVLRQHDPEHMLLALAEQEVLQDALDLPGLQQALARIGRQTVSLQQPASLTPLGFPLWAERLRGQFSNEDWRTRVQRAAQQLERRHDH
ncbi:ligase-associated DNA damage response DEXH box helicase [Stenotrophomonas sp. S48]|uniref:ligase-associated DNA damage response DEXH box helicase n=1 Tax=unclassified Stenotrophomonas TaxID=196198 RepID=UPI0019009846|nr:MULTISPECIES: ligase-associated DNA damage response DEXH box helicase [unclassified Stenotrophomonas]MBK0027232.1 ligase-associated DNA damage response DEXH box helicase [Stenotrophomonas sp. S48]MBK0049378.1 ligase-associated DNA damage response DEXH box helicase [Stenotrophomonas sp. S49]